MPQLVLATSNLGKLQEFQELLTDLLDEGQWELLLKPDELEIEETGETFLANACLKASQVARATAEWAIADDSGLEVEALDGAPGIFSARYGRTDAERIERLLLEVGDELNRVARFVCAVAVSRPDGSIALQQTGICEGEILHTPRGSHGFGYDPVFYVPQYQQSFAEMPPELKRQISHRGQAFRDILKGLKSLSA